MVTFNDLLSVTPFVLLLTMIATGPVLYPHFWHRYYEFIAPLLGVLVMGYYLFIKHEVAIPVEAVVDYVQFIALIGALYIASSGILIDINLQASPLANLCFLWFGAVLSNVIGTTGASMLLIRPYIRLNRRKTKAYHIIFFIFMVSNVGGALTAIADPPNFIGFLKGVPFFWTLRHNWMPWLVALSLLSVIFFVIDSRCSAPQEPAKDKAAPTGWLQLEGKRNIGWLFVVITAVFIDPNLFEQVPYLPYHGHKISFLREIILLIVAYMAHHKADRKILEANGFSLDPLREVVFIFLGIFGTMQPALTLIEKLAQSPQGREYITPNLLYWLTGSLSSVLDNAPTYFNFLTAGMATKGLEVNKVVDVTTYAKEAVEYLKATSISAVFFGAMTYVGNGPNFMVRSIAVEKKIKMPSFGGYIMRYSLPFLLPVLVVVWALFFY
ncbi:MAG: sodium:proton antiporter [Bacteroidota bacterium]